MVKEKALLTINETARAFSVPAFFVRNKVKERAFPVFMSGSRAYIGREVFRQFLEKGGKPYEVNQHNK